MTFEEANKNLKSQGKSYYDAIEAFGVNKSIKGICKSCSHSKYCVYYTYDKPQYVLECNFYEDK